MDEEMRFHVAMEAAELARTEGLSPAEARRRALVAFGGVERHKEAVRDARGTRWLEDAARDARHAVRTLRRSPGFALVAVLTLALGIGASAAVFTLVHAILLSSRYPDAARLVVPYQVVPMAPGMPDTVPWSYPEVRRVLALPAFSDGGAFFDFFEESVLEGDAAADGVRPELVTPGYFRVLGVGAAAGRVLGPADTSADASSAVLVLSHRLWATRYGARPDVVGRTVRLDGVPFTVVGVAAEGFDGVQGNADVWLPFEAGRLFPQYAPMLDQPLAIGGPNVVVRLAAGATREEAAAQVDAVARSTGASAPGASGTGGTGEKASEAPAPPRWNGGVAPFLTARVQPLLASLLSLLAAAVAVLLLLVCVNQAGLLLARAVSRRAETGIRLALGAGRARLFRQALIETLVLTGTGAALGVVFAAWATRALAALWPPPAWSMVLLRGTDVVHHAALAPDVGVLAFTVGVTLLVTLLLGGVSTLAGTRGDPASRLREGGGAAAGASGPGRRTVRRALIVGEVALATALLAGAGLVARSFSALLREDVGVRADGVVAFGLDLSRAAPDPAAAGLLARELAVRVAALPGAGGAALDACAPLEPVKCLFSRSVTVDGRRVPRHAAPPVVLHFVTPGYFRVMGVSLRAGRLLAASDRGTPAVVVGEAAARRFFPPGTAVGHRLDTGAVPEAPVVGVVGDVKQAGLARPAPPAAYYPLEAVDPHAQLRLFVRTAAPAAATVAAVRAAVHGLDPRIAVYDARTLASVVREATAPERSVTALLAFFAAVAVLLAALGLYGVLAHAVAGRRREIGVRMALGATPTRVLAPLLGEGIGLVVLGLALGIAAGLAGGGMLRAFLFGVAPTDPDTWAAIGAVILAVGLLASWLPARRATRIDPAAALRADG